MAFSRIGYEVVDNRRWRHDVVWGDYADWHDVIGAGDDGVRRHGHDRVEVPGRKRVTQIAQIIG
jgi:hypothetical protein